MNKNKKVPLALLWSTALSKGPLKLLCPKWYPITSKVHSREPFETETVSKPFGLFSSLFVLVV
jgi:hypothetical protein